MKSEIEYPFFPISRHPTLAVEGPTPTMSGHSRHGS